MIAAESIRAMRSLGQQLAEIIEGHNFDPALGQVWAGLLIAGAGVDLDDLARSLDMESGEIKSLLDDLIDLGAARQTEKGLCAQTNPLQIAAEVIREREQAMIVELKEALQYALDCLPADAPAQQELQTLVKQVVLVDKLFAIIARGDNDDLAGLLARLAG